MVSSSGVVIGAVLAFWGSPYVNVAETHRPGGPPTATTRRPRCFTACRHLLSRDGCTIVALAPTAAQLPYIEHSQLVIPAAYQAGLGYLQHIIIVTTPAHPEPAQEHTDRPDEAMALYLNLLVFPLRVGRHD